LLCNFLRKFVRKISLFADHKPDTMNLRQFYLFIFSLFISQTSSSQDFQNSIIPKPVSIIVNEGKFEFSENVQIYCTNRELSEEADVFNTYLQAYFGFSLQQSLYRPDRDYIELSLDTTVGHEEYFLEITPNFIKIRGRKAGIFYGLQTLLQLLPVTIDKTAKISCMQIHDYPRFQWRGMHLDVSRHFFPKEFIFKYIDFLALYKMNTFHWHLTDDQGWRIEIKKYPLLTETGAWRKGTLVGHSSDEGLLTDTATYGGFYTQTEIREIVSYAQARHITIVPEIEMPGHSMAALRAYPQFSCSGKQQDVATGWGVFEHVFCTKDEVFYFLEDVLTEVMELFPSTYIHIGGDECPKTSWKKCSACQARIQSEGLKDEYELQSYFITRIEKFINSKGRKLIGWDEILEGGLAPNAAVMSWRGTEGGIDAAKTKHYAVMTPGSHCYFDHYQGDPTNEPLAIGGYTTVEKVYSFEPVPAELDEEEAKYILGAQGNVWTEYMANEKHVEYMIFPRLCALAEVVWTPSKQKDWVDFRTRLIKHFDYFDQRNINYSMSLFEIRKKVICDTIQRKIFVEFSQELSMGEILFWIEKDGKSHTLPQKYTAPIEIRDSYTVLAEVRDIEGKERGYTKQPFVKSLSSGAKIGLTYPPSPYYNYGSPYTLVDGISGRVPWNGKEWMGFSNTDMEAVIDLGKTEEVNKVVVHALKAEASWIYLPVGMTVWVSKDGKKYEKLGDLNADEIAMQGRFLTIGNQKPVKARYVKIHVKRDGVIGPGKQGEGHNAWLFISEIEIL
jgi:hexosaminidase